MEGSHFGYYGVVVGFGGGGEEREAGLLMTWCCVAEAASSDRAAASDRPVLHTDSLITVITPPRRPLADSPAGRRGEAPLETRECNDFCIRSKVRARVVENTHSGVRRNLKIVPHTTAIFFGKHFGT